MRILRVRRTGILADRNRAPVDRGGLLTRHGGFLSECAEWCLHRPRLSGLVIILRSPRVKPCIPFLGDHHGTTVTDSDHDPPVEAVFYIPQVLHYFIKVLHESQVFGDGLGVPLLTLVGQ